MAWTTAWVSYPADKDAAQSGRPLRAVRRGVCHHDARIAIVHRWSASRVAVLSERDLWNDGFVISFAPARVPGICNEVIYGAAEYLSRQKSLSLGPSEHRTSAAFGVYVEFPEGRRRLRSDHNGSDRPGRGDASTEIPRSGSFWKSNSIHPDPIQSAESGDSVWCDPMMVSDEYGEPQHLPMCRTVTLCSLSNIPHHRVLMRVAGKKRN